MRPVPAVGVVVVVRPPVGSPIGARVEPAAVEVIVGEPVVQRPVPDGVIVVAAAKLADDIDPEVLVTGTLQRHCLVRSANPWTDELNGQLLHPGGGSGAVRRIDRAGGSPKGENGYSQNREEHADELLHIRTLLLVRFGS